MISWPISRRTSIRPRPGEITSSHVPMVSRPAEVAQLIETAASAVQSAG